MTGDAIRRRGGHALLLGGLAMALVLAGCDREPAKPPAPSPPGVGWSLVWSDDFTGAAGSRPSAQHWHYSKGTSYPGGAPQWGTTRSSG